MLHILWLGLFIASAAAQGGIQKPVNVTGVVFDAANFACNQINEENESLFWFTLTSAGNATRQVVTGEIYRMDITMGESKCQNIPLNQNATTHECPLKHDPMMLKFRVMVLYKHWVNPEFKFLGTVISQGGLPHPTNVTGVVLDAAHFACNSINEMSNSMDWFTFLVATDATEQIVSGEIFRMDVQMGDSICSNVPTHVNATTKECPLRENAAIWKFSVAVLYRHWATATFTLLDAHQIPV